jgi:DNA phosphorothioation-dependent restriction protein DptG
VFGCLSALKSFLEKQQQNNKTTKQWQTFNVIKNLKEKEVIHKTLNLKLGYAYTCGYLDP